MDKNIARNKKIKKQKEKKGRKKLRSEKKGGKMEQTKGKLK
jgi:hypothetical protein